MPTRSSSSAARSRACFLLIPMCTRSGSMIWKPTVKTGLSEVIGSWKMKPMRAPRTCLIPSA